MGAPAAPVQWERRPRSRYGGNRGPFRHDGHRRPLTRREFLGQGFITGAAMIAAPTLLGFLRTPEARAQAVVDCGIGVALANRLPFLVFVDLGGGASTTGSNVLVGGWRPRAARSPVR